jgi:hypothetical protein
MPMNVIGCARIKLSFWKLKVIADIGSNKELVHMACLTHSVFFFCGGGGPTDGASSR